METRKQTSILSVVIPVHDAASTLSECLDSVLVDQGRQYEVIAINDGSSDTSGDVLSAYAARYPSLRVDTFSINRGVAAARNRGLELATGAYVMFVDADDRLLPGTVPRLLTEVMPRSPDITMFLHHTINEDREPAISRILPAFLSSRLECIAGTSARPIGSDMRVFDLRNPAGRRESFDLAVGNLWAWNGLFRREALGDLRFAPLSNGEDMLFGAQAYCRARTLVNLPLIVYEYRRRPGSLSRTNGLPQVGDRIEAAASIFEAIRASGFYGEVADLLFRKFRTMAFGTVLDRLLCLPPGERPVAWRQWFARLKTLLLTSSAGQPPAALIRFCLNRESPFLVCLLLRQPVLARAGLLSLPGLRRWWLSARRRGIEKRREESAA